MRASLLLVVLASLLAGCAASPQSSTGGPAAQGTVTTSIPTGTNPLPVAPSPHYLNVTQKTCAPTGNGTVKLAVVNVSSGFAYENLQARSAKVPRATLNVTNSGTIRVGDVIALTPSRDFSCTNGLELVDARANATVATVNFFARNLSLSQNACATTGSGAVRLTVVSVSRDFAYESLIVRDTTTPGVTLAVTNSGTINLGDVIALTPGEGFSCTDRLLFVDADVNLASALVTLHT